MATWWDAEAGTHQGRIRVPDAPDGSFVYQFGHALAGTMAKVTDGDLHAIAQAVDFAGIKTVRATIRTRPIALSNLILKARWRFQFGVTGADAFSIPTGERNIRTYRDVTIPVANLPPGPANLYFQLDLEGASGPFKYEIELPGIELDQIEEDTTELRPGIGNRIPEPDWREVPIYSPISFILFDTGSDGVDLNNTTIEVDGLLIFENGSFVNGWDVTGSQATPTSYGFSFLCWPPSAYASDADVTVVVMSSYVGGPIGSFHDKWMFHTVDVTRPYVVSATQLEARSVRVTFNEPMRRLDDGDAGDALNPSSYVLELVSEPPAVVPEIVAVVPDDDAASVILLLSDDVTHKTTYRVVVSNVRDISNNVLDTPNSAEFLTTTRLDVPGRNWWLIRKLPAGLVETDTKLGGILRKFVQCLQVLFDELLADIDEWPEIIDPELAPEQFVDAMLEDLGNPFPFVLDETTKRQLAMLLVPLYQQKGTDQGMIDAIRLFIGIEVQIVSPGLDGIWMLDESELDIDTDLGTADLKTIYSFDVISPVNLTDEQRLKIRAIVAYMRRAPTHLRFIIEPELPPPIPDHWELGLSDLDDTTYLHD